MGKFLGWWLVVSIIGFPFIGFWLSTLLNLHAAKTYRTAMLYASSIHALTTAMITVLIVSLH
jgi:hypothetical protein